MERPNKVMRRMVCRFVHTIPVHGLESFRTKGPMAGVPLVIFSRALKGGWERDLRDSSLH
jgi:hypothetical protein